MTPLLESRVRAICEAHGSSPVRLLDIARTIQSEFHCVSQESIDLQHHASVAKATRRCTHVTVLL